MSTVATEVELERIGHSTDDRTTNENPLVLNHISDAQEEEGEADQREVSPPERVNETSLAPVDSGFGAWSFVSLSTAHKVHLLMAWSVSGSILYLYNCVGTA